MNTGCTISILQPDDVRELSRFLVRGFNLPADTSCFSEKTLRWKYLEPAAGPAPASLIARANGGIVGHIGFCTRSFLVRGEHPREVPTTHPIDWLASPDHPSVGLQLLLRGLGTTPTHYSVGGNPIARKMLLALGFQRRALIPIYHKILRPMHRRLGSTRGLLRTWLGAARDLTLWWRQRPKPRLPIQLSSVSGFASLSSGLASGPQPLLFTTRTPALLDHFLAYPDGCISGWTIHHGGRLLGHALLSIIRAGRLRQGRLVECFLEGTDGALWQSAVAELTGELGRQAVDEVTCFASTPWLQQALRENGYREAGALEFLLRDRGNLLPTAIPWHITQLEADHAYLE
jgi:hypothetical protein